MSQPSSLESIQPASSTTEPVSQDVIGYVQHQIASQYSELTGGNQALDPATWGVIIDLVANLLKNCMANRPATAKDYITQANRGGLLARFHVRRHVRAGLIEQYGIGAWRRHDGEAIVESIVRAGATADPVRFQEFLNEIEMS